MKAQRAPSFKKNFSGRTLRTSSLGELQLATSPFLSRLLRRCVAGCVADGAERPQEIEIDKVCDANGRGVEHNRAQDRKRDQIQKELLGVVALRLAWKLLDLDGVLEVLVAQHPQSNQL